MTYEEEASPTAAICILLNAASFVNKVRNSIFGGVNLIYRRQEMLCHDPEYSVIKL